MGQELRVACTRSRWPDHNFYLFKITHKPIADLRPRMFLPLLVIWKDKVCPCAKSRLPSKKNKKIQDTAQHFQQKNLNTNCGPHRSSSPGSHPEPHRSSSPGPHPEPHYTQLTTKEPEQLTSISTRTTQNTHMTWTPKNMASQRPTKHDVKLHEHKNN